MKQFKILKHFRYSSALVKAIDESYAAFLKEFKRKTNIELVCSFVFNPAGELKDKSVRAAYNKEDINEVIWFENYFDNLV